MSARTASQHRLAVPTSCACITKPDRACLLTNYQLEETQAAACDTKGKAEQLLAFSDRSCTEAPATISCCLEPLCRHRNIVLF